MGGNPREQKETFLDAKPMLCVGENPNRQLAVDGIATASSRLGFTVPLARACTDPPLLNVVRDCSFTQVINLQTT